MKSSVLFANITKKMAKPTSSIGICFVSSNLCEIHEIVSDGHWRRSNKMYVHIQVI